MSVTALCYNWGFFTLLAYTPFPMHLGIHQLGYVFTGWGVLVGSFAVFGAPRLEGRFGTVPTLMVNLTLLAVDLVVIAVFTSSKAALIVAVIVSGAFVGVNNTLTTQAVMQVAPVERPVASAAYGFVRFIGGGLAPYCAGKLADHFNVHVPFYLGAVSVMLGVVVMGSGRRLLEAAREETAVTEAVTQAGSAAPPRRAAAPILAAVDSVEHSGQVISAAADFSRRLGAPVEVLHVVETDVVGEQAVELGDPASGRALVDSCVARLSARGVDASGRVARVVKDHGEVGRFIASAASSTGARLIVVGSPAEGDSSAIFDASLSRQLLEEAECDVYVVRLGQPEGSPMPTEV